MSGSWVINNQTAPDNAATPATTLDNLPLIGRVNIDVANSAIYWQLKQSSSNSALYTQGTWGPATYMAPGSRTLFRSSIIGFRFWAAVTAANLPSGQTQAQVTVEAVG